METAKAEGRKVVITCREPEGQERLANTTYKVDGVLLSDGRLLTYGTGTDGRDSLWASLQGYGPNGGALADSHEIGESVSIDLEDVLNADHDNAEFNRESCLTTEEQAAKERWVTNDLAVDSGRQEEIQNNHLTGDTRVVLCRAPVLKATAPGVVGAVGAWLYYLTTNGDPVAVGPDSDSEHIHVCAEMLGVAAEELEQLVADGGTPAHSPMTGPGFVAVGNDGMRPVVWGIGKTEAWALADAKAQLKIAEDGVRAEKTQYVGMDLTLYPATAEQIEAVQAGDVSWPQVH